MYGLAEHSINSWFVSKISNANLIIKLLPTFKRSQMGFTTFCSPCQKAAVNTSIPKTVHQKFINKKLSKPFVKIVHTIWNPWTTPHRNQNNCFPVWHHKGEVLYLKSRTCCRKDSMQIKRKKALRMKCPFSKLFNSKDNSWVNFEISQQICLVVAVCLFDSVFTSFVLVS